MIQEKDRQTRAMYVKVPFPFVSFEDFFLFKQGFLSTLRGIVDFDDLRNKRILDAGCGTGEKACVLAELAKEVVATDFSSSSIARARENKDKLGLKNIEFIESSLLSFENIKAREKFDVVFCSGVLHHLSNPYSGWQNILSCLKPGGLIIISLYHRFGYLNHWWKYKLINWLAAGDDDKKFNLAVRLFCSRAKIAEAAARAKIFDSYVHPQVAIFSLSYVYKKWFKSNGVGLKNIFAKHSDTRFILSDSAKLELKIKLIDLWFSLRQKGFVFISGIKKEE